MLILIDDANLRNIEELYEKYPYDGVQIAKDIHTMGKAAGYEAEILGASFKNSQQILEMGKFGIGSVTVNSDTLKTLAFNQVAENAVQDFIHDFEGCCGAGKPCWIFRMFSKTINTPDIS